MALMDRVFIRDLLLRAIIGINDEERVKKQDVLVNIELEADCRPAAASDAIEDAVNYRDIAKQTIDLVENSRFFLVEKLAEEIARVCLADGRVQRVRVTVEKPTAVRFAKSVGVSIERGRGDA
ncbi:MAG TPA: dihydroneopterin aldolase [Planctomycetaceae bacterium]